MSRRCGAGGCGALRAAGWALPSGGSGPGPARRSARGTAEGRHRDGCAGLPDVPPPRCGAGAGLRGRETRGGRALGGFYSRYERRPNHTKYYVQLKFNNIYRKVAREGGPAAGAGCRAAPRVRLSVSPAVSPAVCLSVRPSVRLSVRRGLQGAGLLAALRAVPVGLQPLLVRVQSALRDRAPSSRYIFIRNQFFLFNLFSLFVSLPLLFSPRLIFSPIPHSGNDNEGARSSLSPRSVRSSRNTERRPRCGSGPSRGRSQPKVHALRTERGGGAPGSE